MPRENHGPVSVIISSFFFSTTPARVFPRPSLLACKMSSDTITGPVQLMGKGRKQRMVPLWKETTRLICNWVKIATLKSDQPLLPNRFGSQMTRTAVQQRKRCVECLEIEVS